MTDGGVRIRSATDADAADLASFAARVFQETFGAQNRSQDMEAYLRSSFGEEIQRAELRDPARLTLLATSGGGIVAYATIGLGALPQCSLPPSPDRTASVDRFYVDAAWHGRGVATTLMRTVLHEAESRGFRRLWLGVWKENPRAIAFYRKFGFEMAGEQTFVLGEDVQEDWVMLRDGRAR